MIKITKLFALVSALLWSTQAAANDFAGTEAYVSFQNKAAQAGLTPEQVDYWMQNVSYLPSIIRTMSQPGESKEWYDYKKNFLFEGRYSLGRKFARNYSDTLNRAAAEFGVPQSIILGIIGVETAYGSNMGNIGTASALATLAFRGDRRNDYFSDELLSLIKLSQQGKLNALTLKGSYAGAFGYGQFMPSSYATYAIDYNGDGVISMHNPQDAIGSVANYLKQKGWQPNTPIAVQARFMGSDDSAVICKSIDEPTTASALYALGLQPLYEAIYANDSVCGIRLLDTSSPRYYFTYPNFRVITLYNRSRMYAMAVWLLGKEVYSSI